MDAVSDLEAGGEGDGDGQRYCDLRSWVSLCLRAGDVFEGAEAEKQRIPGPLQ